MFLKLVLVDNLGNLDLDSLVYTMWSSRNFMYISVVSWLILMKMFSVQAKLSVQSQPHFCCVVSVLESNSVHLDQFCTSRQIWGICVFWFHASFSLINSIDTSCIICFIERCNIQNILYVFSYILHYPTVCELLKLGTPCLTTIVKKKRLSTLMHQQY